MTAAAEHGHTVLLPGQTPAGGHILSVLLKRSYRISAGRPCLRAAQDQPLLAGDVFWDTPMNSSVRMESDFVPYKPGTDVVLLGRAYAPGGRPATGCMTALQIGGRRKQVRVIGDRTARFTTPSTPPAFTDPQPFTELPLQYERAYGGSDVFSDTATVYPYPRNPRGCGFAVANVAVAVNGLRLPNLEDPDAPLQPERLCLGDYARWTEQPPPAGYGWYGKNWQPRSLLAGVMPADRAVEQQLRAAYARLLAGEQRAAYLKHPLPAMDFAYFHGASQRLNFAFGDITPGAPVGCENLSPDGRLVFHLSTDQPRIAVDIGNGLRAPDTVLHTVQIRLDDGEVDQVWRAALDYPGPDWLPHMRRLHIEVDDGAAAAAKQ